MIGNENDTHFVVREITLGSLTGLTAVPAILMAWSYSNGHAAMLNCCLRGTSIVNTSRYKMTIILQKWIFLHNIGCILIKKSIDFPMTSIADDALFVKIMASLRIADTTLSEQMTAMCMLRSVHMCDRKLPCTIPNNRTMHVCMHACYMHACYIHPSIHPYIHTYIHTYTDRGQD